MNEHKQSKFIIDVSASAKRPNRSTTRFFSYDSHTAEIVIQAEKDGKLIDQTLVDTVEIYFESVNLKYRPIDGLKWNDTMEIGTDGMYSYILPDDFLNYEGLVAFDVYINYKNGDKADSSNRIIFEQRVSAIDRAAGAVELVYIKDMETAKRKITEQATEITENFLREWNAFEAGSTAKMQELEQRIDEQTEIFNKADVYNKAEIEDKLEPFALQTDIAEVSAQLAQTKNQVYSKNTKKIKPLITFYLDDGHANDYDVVLPKASSLNIPLTISLHNSGDLINRPDDLKELVNTHGWEVHAHTVGNTDLRTLTLEEQKQTMRENKEFLENTFGFDVRGVCYPMGHSNSDTYVAAREYFDVGLESYFTRVPENLPPIQTYGLQRINLTKSLGSLKQMIDNIKGNGEGWLVFYSHSALYNQAGSEKETLFALMDYAVASGIDVVTVGEAMELYQNTLDIGDKVYSDKVAKIGSDGNVDFTDIPFVVDNDGRETINEKKGIDFLPNKITISHFGALNESNIPFDSGRGTLYTDRLNEQSIYVGADAVQTFSSHLGNSYVRKYGGGVWGEWTSTSGFNTARIRGDIENKPITEYPENKVTAVSYMGADNTGISVGSGIGTVITMRLSRGIGTLSRQFFYPINESSYYTRRWLGSNQWDRWERVSTNIIHRAVHDYGTLGADETKVFSFDIDGVSANDSVNVNFNYGLINGVIYYPFIEGYNAVKIKLTNVTSSSKLVGSRGTVINVTKTGM